MYSLAKFKKKHSQPTKGKDESMEEPIKEPQIESSKTPPVEDSLANNPPVDPPINHVRQGEKDSKLNKLFWFRIIVAVIAGSSATLLFDSVEGEERRWSSIVYMIIIFIVTIIIAKMMRIPFALSDRKKIVTQGIGSYVTIYLFMWVLSYTVVNLNDSGSMPFP